LPLLSFTKKNKNSTQINSNPAQRKFRPELVSLSTNTLVNAPTRVVKNILTKAMIDMAWEGITSAEYIHNQGPRDALNNITNRLDPIIWGIKYC